ncbi:XdhC family protein [Halobellus clavatus]|jgi:xanthine dehydrogenase accessory factor|uniref:Xanthine and CO dehydrogenase maturation factor, XdhC/CoxF family n=1 Tax=Halobellus clavatus TaxID=660517 RepID=A0A1H3FYB0_9EURY|nr:XdhC/CoxI family protein [Halobellus clavatus]SDX95835.1 Xanthine and CO dehydrogenase maturation factor, XdhC/CoxF family [Halobellus clavatus]
MGLYQTAADLTAAGETVALVTVTEVDGSAPQDPGASMLVRADGTTEGTIGGGTVEELTREAALEAIETREPRSETWELRPGGNTGMVCGGEMSVFINVLTAEARLVIAGAGHIAVPLSAMALTMGYEVWVIDDREEYADPDRFDDAVTVLADDYDEGITRAGITDNTAVAIASRSGTFDRIAAQEALERGAYYVGLVASDTKAAHVIDGLRDDGVDDEALARLHAPVGIEVGGGDPEDVALSILAQLNRVRTGLPPTLDG